MVESPGTFDTIVVGAGSAGCVLANRLSSDPYAKILILEAGGRDVNPWIHVPAGYLFTRGKPDTDWCFRTEAAVQLGGRTLPFPLGRVLGGSSSINGMLYVRGHASDYERWRQLGNAGWGWDDVRPYFARSESFDGAPAQGRGEDGEWRVETKRFGWDILGSLIEAGASLGIPFNLDYNSGDNNGVWHCQVNQDRGWRSSAAKAFLRPALRRPNLMVVTHSRVDRLIFEGRKAVGVEYERDGRSHRAFAREIVLAAGAIGSPLLLQRSGVGSPPLLAQHGIPVVLASEGVGENLQDHVQFRPVFRVSNTKTMNERARSVVSRALIGLEYALFRTGPLSMAPSQLGLFTRTDPAKVAPDLQMLFQLGSVDAAGRFDPFPAISVPYCNVRPESRGRVRIRSADPREPPVIDPNYLTAEADRSAVVPGLRRVRAIMGAASMARYAPHEIHPGGHLQSDADLYTALAESGSSLFHPVGTCKMGSGPGAVVDERLRVRGLDGLRVADASVMPSMVSGNTNAATVMIAEKAADMIREDRRSV